MRTLPTKWDNRNISTNTQKAAEQQANRQRTTPKRTKYQVPITWKAPKKQPTARELSLKAPITKY